MSILSQIYSEGGDALKNYFEVAFEGMPPPVYSTYKIYNPDDITSTINYNGGMQDNRAVARVKTVTLPTYGVKTADINFYTTQIRVPVAKMEFTPEFTISFRVDQDWALYQALIKWRNTVFDPESGYTKFDSVNPAFLLLNKFINKGLGLQTMAVVGRCNAITISALQKNIKNVQPEKPLRIWRFRGAYPTKIDGLGFDYSGSDSHEVSVTFSYLDMSEYYDNGSDTWNNT